MADYKPVPVEVARQIAVQFEKCMVVVLCYDEVHQRTHTTTYGVSALDKAAAAFLGEEFTASMGANLAEKKTFEDFRATPDDAKAAKQRENNDRIARERNQLVRAAWSVVHAHFEGNRLPEEIAELHDLLKDFDLRAAGLSPIERNRDANPNP